MIAILFVALFGLFNPGEQFNKSSDVRRESDLNQIKVSLDTYFNDTGCYPTSLSFGATWKNGNTIYYKNLPNDPDTADFLSVYRYETDGSSCPQWNVLYATLRSKSATTDTNKILCALESPPMPLATNCLPSDFKSLGYNYCVVSGTPNCAYIAANTLPGVAGHTTPTPSPAIAASCQGVPPGNLNYKRYLCNGTCQDAGQGNGYYCVSNCEGACP